MGIRLLCVVALWCALGCGPAIGASTVPEVHAAYNDSLVRAQTAQLLLNLVRMRYRDTPYFVDVASVTNQQTFLGSLGFVGDLGVDPTSHTVMHPSAGGSYSVTPTVVYLPLQGEAFVRRMVAPLSLYTVLALSTAGWNSSRVFRLAIDRVNDVRNAPSAAGPTPRDAPPYRDFLDLVDAIRTLQSTGALEVAPLKPTDVEACVFVVNSSHDPQVAEAARTLQRLLKVDARGSYVVVPFTGTTEPNQVHFRMRSVLSALYYLSAAVDAPPEHERLGLVTVTKNSDGSRFDWRDVFHNLFHVRTSSSEPTLAFTKTYYRGYWFYIADDDLDTKSTFQLIAHLVAMQAGASAMQSPLLTISAAGH
jgi:hypothetical protein